MSNSSTKGTALVTGASSGIGKVYAERLAHRGYDLILVARDKERLDALAAKLKAEAGVNVKVFKADLTAKNDLLQVEQRLREDGSITLLVNNAGLGGNGPLAAADPDGIEKIIQLNVLAVARLAAAAAHAFAARKSGTIVNVGSVLGLAPERFPGVYPATKAFVLAFSHSLQHELGDKGIRIQAVLPGATATDLWETAGLHYKNLPAAIVMSAEDMVDAALIGLDQGEQVTIPPLHDGEEWTRFEAARRTISQHLGNAVPARRYSPSAGAHE